MNSQRKLRRALVLAPLVGAGLGGALLRSRSNAADASAATPAVLQVASFPDLDRAARAAAARWARRHPQIELKIVSRQYADHHLAMTTSLATGSGLPDVMAIDLRYIGKFAASGGFVDLNEAPYGAARLKDAFAPFALRQGEGPRSTQIALPADIGPGTLLYRHDLLARAGLAEADLTRDWSSYLASGRQLKAATGAFLMADAADLRDIALRQGLQEGEGLYFDAEDRPVVDSARFARAFELGLAARRAGLDARAAAWSNDWAAGFKQGRIATQMMGAWLVGHLKNWLAPETAGLWRSAPLPGGVQASYGGAFYAIPKKAQHKAEAWDFIQMMCADRDVQLDSLRVLDSFPALLSAQQDPLMDEPLAFLGGQRARQMWRETAARVPAVRVSRFDALATDVVRDEFEKVVSQAKAIPAALRDAQALIQRRARRRPGSAA